MPGYLFNLVSDHARIPDRQGIDLVDAQAAHREAVLIAGELVKPGSLLQQRKWRGWSIEVADERGEGVFTVPLASFFAGTARAAESAGQKFDASYRSEVDVAERRTTLSSETLRLAADVRRHVERFERQRRELAAEMARVRRTARSSARLIRQSRSLAATLGLK